MEASRCDRFQCVDDVQSFEVGINLHGDGSDHRQAQSGCTGNSDGTLALLERTYLR
jgi:hypothetical protein